MNFIVKICPQCGKNYFDQKQLKCTECGIELLGKWEGCQDCIYFERGFGPFENSCNIDANKCRCRFYQTQPGNNNNNILEYPIICYKCQYFKQSKKIHTKSLCFYYRTTVNEYNYCKHFKAKL